MTWPSQTSPRATACVVTHFQMCNQSLRAWVLCMRTLCRANTGHDTTLPRTPPLLGRPSPIYSALAGTGHLLCPEDNDVGVPILMGKRRASGRNPRPESPPHNWDALLPGPDPHPRPSQPCADRAVPLIQSWAAAGGAPPLHRRCVRSVEFLRSSASSVPGCFVTGVYSSPSFFPALVSW